MLPISGSRIDHARPSATAGRSDRTRAASPASAPRRSGSIHAHSAAPEDLEEVAGGDRAGLCDQPRGLRRREPAALDQPAQVLRHVLERAGDGGLRALVADRGQRVAHERAVIVGCRECGAPGCRRSARRTSSADSACRPRMRATSARRVRVWGRGGLGTACERTRRPPGVRIATVGERVPSIVGIPFAGCQGATLRRRGAPPAAASPRVRGRAGRGVRAGPREAPIRSSADRTRGSAGRWRQARRSPGNRAVPTRSSKSLAT